MDCFVMRKAGEQKKNSYRPTVQKGTRTLEEMQLYEFDTMSISMTGSLFTFTVFYFSPKRLKLLRDCPNTCTIKGTILKAPSFWIWDDNDG